MNTTDTIAMLEKALKTNGFPDRFYIRQAENGVEQYAIVSPASGTNGGNAIAVHTDYMSILEFNRFLHGMQAQKAGTFFDKATRKAELEKMLATVKQICEQFGSKPASKVGKGILAGLMAAEHLRGNSDPIFYIVGIRSCQVSEFERLVAQLD
jgi:hypothetical protein